MSLTAVRTLFRDRLNALGYVEHSDGFDDSNRSQTNLDMMYRLDSGPVVGSTANQTIHQFDFDITLQITLRGDRSNVDLVDRAYLISEEILADILQESVRVGTEIKNINPGVIEVSPYSPTDDNDLMLSMSFTGIVLCQF